jgi:Transposase, Mutator family
VKEQSTERLIESRPSWEEVEAFARQRIQTWFQRLLEEELEELLGRARYARRNGTDAPAGYRNGLGKPRWLTLSAGTITVRRPRVRGLTERFESRLLPLFKRRTETVGTVLPGGSGARLPVGGRSLRPLRSSRPAPPDTRPPPWRPPTRPRACCLTTAASRNGSAQGRRAIAAVDENVLLSRVCAGDIPADILMPLKYAVRYAYDHPARRRSASQDKGARCADWPDPDRRDRGRAPRGPCAATRSASAATNIAPDIQGERPPAWCGP